MDWGEGEEEEGEELKGGGEEHCWGRVWGERFWGVGAVLVWRVSIVESRAMRRRSRSSCAVSQDICTGYGHTLSAVLQASPCVIRGMIVKTYVPFV